MAAEEKDKVRLLLLHIGLARNCIKIGSRGKGQSAIAAAAYRSGEKLTDTETGLISDYTRKGGVVFSEISLCENAPAEYSDRVQLCGTQFIKLKRTAMLNYGENLK